MADEHDPLDPSRRTTSYAKETAPAPPGTELGEPFASAASGRQQIDQERDRALPPGRTRRPHPVLEPDGPVRTDVARRLEQQKQDQALERWKALNEELERRGRTQQREISRDRGRDRGGRGR